MYHMKRLVADLCLILIAFVWGTTFVLVQDAISTLAPFSFLAVRFGFAAILLYLFTRFFVQHPDPLANCNRKQNLTSGLVLGTFLFLGYALQTIGLLYTTSGKAGFLTGVNVALVPIFSYFILRVRVKTASILGVVLAIIGLYLLAFVDFSSINRGDVLAFLCAIFFALQIVYTGKYSNQTSLFHLVTFQLGTVALLSAIFAFFFEPWQHIFSPAVLFHPTVVLALVITSLFATALAFIAQTYVQKFSTPTRVAIIFATEPVFAALADYWWQGEILEGRALLGCFLILSGMILAEIQLPRLYFLKKRINKHHNIEKT